MKTSLFSPILILLIFTLFAKASVLFGRIQEQTTDSSDPNSLSVIVDTAYAKSSPTTQNDLNLANDLQNNNMPETKKEKALTVGREIETENYDENNKTNVQSFTKSEIELLKELSKRREKLNDEQKDIDIREKVLEATENKIDQKVVELKNLQTHLENLIKQYDQKENAKLLSLVKIYENMKAKDAAKIFNELEMQVLLRVVSNMKEIKVAPIIANMDPAKARDLSIELANQNPLE